MAHSGIEGDGWETVLGRMGDLVEQVSDLVLSPETSVRVLHELDQRVSISPTLLGEILRALALEQQPRESGLEEALKAMPAKLDRIDTTLGRLTAAVEAGQRA